MSGVYSFIGSIGMILYAKIGGMLIHSFGAASPFGMVGISDLIFAFVIVAFYYKGKFVI